MFIVKIIINLNSPGDDTNLIEFINYCILVILMTSVSMVFN